MAGVQDSALAIAVSRAGGLGSLPCAMLTPEALSRELETIDAAGLAAYNLNFFCHQEPQPDQLVEAEWRKLLAPYYKEYGVEAANLPVGASRQPFSEATLELIRPFRPPVVSFHFGLPRSEWVDQIKGWGGKVWSSATTLEEANWLANHGADVLIAQGVEAGGHRGMFLTSELATQGQTRDLLAAITQVVDVPVIAAGGIATPGQVKQYLDSGAIAVQVGTAFLLCEEATTSALHRELLESDAATNTRLTNLFSGRPARGIVNRLMSELGPMNSSAPAFPLATAALLPLRAAAEQQGKTDFSPLWCGTDPSGCRAVSAAEQVQWLASEATHIRP